jgi:hypothetical protein
MNMLRHFYNDFMAFVPLQLPQLLDVTTMEEPQFYGDYVLLTFPLRTPYELDEVMDMFEDDMELITLYHHIPMRTEKFGHSTCAYSNPAFGQMFKMNAKTDTEGNVNSILVTIYDSLEQMYGDLCLDLELHSKSGFLKYKKDKSDVLMNFHMRNTLYRQMVYCINAYRTWIEVADDNLYKEHIISRTDRTDYLVSRTLVLRAFKTNGIHAEGMTWTIPEHELDKALAIYRKQDSTFKQRIKKAAMYFSPKDAETLIRLATYGIVQLELIVRPTPIPEKPYYLCY